jgi:hypothetical protein
MLSLLIAALGAPVMSADDIDPAQVRLTVRLFDKRDEVYQVELKCYKDEIFDLNSITNVDGKKINFADKTAKIELIKGPAWQKGDRVILLDVIKKDKVGLELTIKDPGQHNLNTFRDGLSSGSWADRAAGIHFKPAESDD